MAPAHELIKDLGHGDMITGLTFGQFSLIDLIQATLRVTGPADVAISTWSAGFYDIDAAQKLPRQRDDPDDQVRARLVSAEARAGYRL